MTEENKALVDREGVLKQLKDMESESEQSMESSYIPTIKVKNDKVEVDVNGKKKKVLCDPEFKITNKVGEEYQDSLYAKEFNAVILSIHYYVCSKWEEKPTNPYFKSQEFDSWSTPLVLRADKEISRPYSYNEFKEIFADKYSLVMVLYVLIDGKVKKVKVTGAGRGSVWDYLKTIDRKTDSVTMYYTKFSVETEETDSGLEFNKLKLEKVEDETPDYETALKYKQEIKNALHSFQENIMSKANKANPVKVEKTTIDKIEKKELPDML